MPRLGVTVTEEMYQALEKESKVNNRAPISALVRLAIEKWLTERGYNIENDVEWGGYRRHQNDPESAED